MNVPETSASDPVRSQREPEAQQLGSGNGAAGNGRADVQRQSEPGSKRSATSSGLEAERPAWARYGVAFGCVAVGWVATEALAPEFGPTPLPFIFFFPAVAVAAWYGGLGPGALAAILGALAADWFFIEPVHSWSFARSSDWARLGAFLFSSAFIVVAMEAMHRTRARMAADVAALTRMHELSARVVGEKGMQPLLQEIMDAAVAIVGADRGTLQLLEGDSLRIVAHCGHQAPFLKFFESAETRASVCGEATKQAKRVVVPDVEASPLFAGTESLEVLRAAGVRAVQSTPMVGRSGKLLGMLTTQWGRRYLPDEHDLSRIDLLVRQASDLIEQARAEAELRVARRGSVVYVSGILLALLRPTRSGSHLRMMSFCGWWVTAGRTCSAEGYCGRGSRRRSICPRMSADWRN